jgi:hypothetical protein
LRGSTVVPWQILQEAVEAAKGRRIPFIDSCHFGNALPTPWQRRLSRQRHRLHGRQLRPDIEGGRQIGARPIHTYAVLEGLEGKGGIAQMRHISTKELADYAIKRVEELAKARNASQEPQYFKGRDSEDYILAHR